MVVAGLVVASLGLARPGSNAAASGPGEQQQLTESDSQLHEDAIGPGTVVEAPAGSSVAPSTLDSLSLESAAFRDALATRDRTVEAIATAERRIPVLERALVDLRSANEQLADGLPRLVATAEAADFAVGNARDNLAELAVLRYVYADSRSVVDVLSSGVEEQARNLERDLVIRTASAAHTYLLGSTEQTRADATGAITTARSGVVEVAVRIDALLGEISRTRSVIETQTALLPGLNDDVDAERKVSRITGSDLTVVVVDAYLRAAETMQAETPACGVTWTLLAGIGYVESRHGTYGGSSVGLDGLVSPSIIGIALNGQRDTAVITDSDGGRLMQFIPSTWRGYGRDGNDDGRVDPQNIYDSALSAADYLCSRGSVSTPAGEVGAILRYNSSMAYVRAVQVNTQRYGKLGIDVRPSDADVSG